MKNLEQWQREFADAVAKKFSNDKLWTEQDRVLSILRQLADVGGSIQTEQKILASNKHGHQDTNHRIAALIADIFILCDKRNFDLDAELEKVLAWYKKPSEQNSPK